MMTCSLHNSAQNIVPFPSAQYKMVMDGNLAVLVKGGAEMVVQALIFELCFFFKILSYLKKIYTFSHIFSMTANILIKFMYFEAKFSSIMSISIL